MHTWALQIRPSGGAWAPSSVKALVERAEELGLIWPRQISGVEVT